ncbi:MAG: DUF2681 domain-containing protein [[Pasteurella] aerogenes]|nr:DUF2681 domain-containing protein [[Pasteurella] aerogenes]
MMNLMLLVAGVVAVAVGYALFKLKQANDEIERILKTNGELTAKNEQLQMQKAVAETQVKNAKVRKDNETKSITSDRSKLIDGLHATGDLRD